MSEADRLALNPSVAPRVILSGHPQHQSPDRQCGGWAARSSSWVGPATGDEVGVPAQQRSGRHEPHPAQRDGQQPAQRTEHGAVQPGQPWPGVVAAQHGDLMTQHQNLDVLGGIRAGEQRQPAQHAGKHQVRESEGHSERSCCAVPGRWSADLGCGGRGGGYGAVELAGDVPLEAASDLLGGLALGGPRMQQPVRAQVPRRSPEESMECRSGEARPARSEMRDHTGHVRVKKHFRLSGSRRPPDS